MSTTQMFYIVYRKEVKGRMKGGRENIMYKFALYPLGVFLSEKMLKNEKNLRVSTVGGPRPLARAWAARGPPLLRQEVDAARGVDE